MFGSLNLKPETLKALGGGGGQCMAERFWGEGLPRGVELESRRV